MTKRIQIALKDLLCSEQLKVNFDFLNMNENDEESEGENLFDYFLTAFAKLQPSVVDLYIQERPLQLYHAVDSDAKLLNVYQVRPHISLLTLKVLKMLNKLNDDTKINCYFIEKDKYDPDYEWNPDIADGLDFYTACKLLDITFSNKSRANMDDFFQFTHHNVSNVFIKGAKKSAFGTLDDSQDNTHLSSVDGKYSERYLSYNECINYPSFLNYSNKKITFYCKVCNARRTEYVKKATSFFRVNTENEEVIFSCLSENTKQHDIVLNTINTSEFKADFKQIMDRSDLTKEQKQIHLLLYMFNNKKYYGFHRKSKQ